MNTDGVARQPTGLICVHLCSSVVSFGVASHPSPSSAARTTTTELALVRRFPALARVPRHALTALPTPVQPLVRLERRRPAAHPRPSPRRPPPPSSPPPRSPPAPSPPPLCPARSPAPLPRSPL